MVFSVRVLGEGVMCGDLVLQMLQVTWFVVTSKDLSQKLMVWVMDEAWSCVVLESSW
jgi:hypothetical protein